MGHVSSVSARGSAPMLGSPGHLSTVFLTREPGAEWETGLMFSKGTEEVVKGNKDNH